ncbi:uncharacterized protein LOC133179416 [Saccostrea echinata]|uniref:uncharacterized protein LOC133179416 n=1 Tax=Saccostrea echinata TaxID=191078 RepID=UPI002A81EF2E|nr:uncharacterized protein LOC133179416 [Saccostrea echinata]
MSHGILLITAALVCTLTPTVLGSYEGRSRTMLGEIPLVGVTKTIPIGNFLPSIASPCCPCPAPSRIYPERYIVIDRMSPPPLPSLPRAHDDPLMISPAYHSLMMSPAHHPLMMSPPPKPPTIPSDPEPTPETSGGSNGGGDR